MGFVMSQGYLDYWDLDKDPFYLAPDDEMMYLGGQYYECFERLLYAVNTNKGGALIVSEEAGLGKTTILLRLMSEMREDYGEQFRYAFIDHPTLTTAQLVADISKGLTGTKPGDDKYRNLTTMKESLISLKRQGGRALVVVDEAQMLCDRKDVLQELRILMNLTYEKEHLFTVILSGQRPLWDAVKSIPELWQRLPVKYYLMPLKLEDTKNLLTCRLEKAGLEDGNEVFTQEAIEIVHRYSKGTPRTIVALADLSLLIGFTYQASKIGFKEVSKAINAMSGKSEGYPYAAQNTEQPRSVLKSLLRKIKG